MLNVHRYNENCIVWKYGKDGILLNRLDRIGLENWPKVEDPLATHISGDGWTLCLASGQRDPESPKRAGLHGLPTEGFSLVRIITIVGWQLVSAVSEEPPTGTLWIAGLSTPEVPECPDLTAEPFYQPCLAEAPADVDTAEAIGISDPTGGDLEVRASVLRVDE